jgi:hypothetical protein
MMASSSLTSWAKPRLSQLLPLDDDSLTQIITYTASLSKDASAEHLKNLLGDSPAALEFTSSFNSRRHDEQPTITAEASTSDKEGPKARNAKQKKGKQKAGLHSAGPPRRPENYGNLAGGYVKSDNDGDYMTSLPSQGGSASARREDGKTQAAVTSLSNTPSLSQEPAAHQRPKTKSAVSPYESSPASSRNQSPDPQTSKPPPSASGSLISDYLPNVKSKAARGGAARHGHPGGTSTKGAAITTSTNNIEDLTAAIAALEVSTNPTSERRTCTCNALIHPLFSPAPNCLNCGKIICSLEGLQPCSFCGAPVLEASEVQDMIKELRMERGNEKMRAHNEGRHYDPGSSRAPQSSSSNPEAASKLDAAKAHRDKLLNFQAQNAQRTKVVDETADFETPNSGSTQWMSPAQRALALKKQQRVLRDMEEKARPEWERNKTVMSLDIKAGKVVRTYQKGLAETNAAEEAEELDPYELNEPGGSGDGRSGAGAFGRNPLLASGSLIRPVWKAPDSKLQQGTTDGDTSRREKKQTWRRVQDDNDDNEQWILDGGLHGYDD